MTRRFDFPWTLAVCAGAIAATACWLGPGRELAGGLVADGRLIREPWRALTGPFVHATWGHLVRDIALTAIVGVAYEQPLRRVWPALVIAALVVPTVVSLLFGGVSVYYGISGLSHALIAVAVGFELRGRQGRARLYAGVVGAVLLVKVGYEVVTGAPAVPMDLGEGVRQLPIAHAAGLVVGAAFASSSRMMRWLPSTRAKPRRSTRSSASCAAARSVAQQSLATTTARPRSSAWRGGADAVVGEPRRPGGAPPAYRVNGPLSNRPEFSAAFSCSPGRRMVQSARCSVW